MQVVRTSTLTYTWSSEGGDSCNEFKEDVRNILGPYNVLHDLSFPYLRQEIALLSGSHSLMQPVIDIASNKTGDA